MRLSKSAAEWLWMPLLLASWLWAAAAYLKRRFYPYRWRFRCRIPIVCVGNIHSGGSGKTPLVIAITQHFSSRNPIIVSRGYGGRRSRTGAKVLLTAEEGALEYGDEAWMLANRLNVPVYIGKRRADVLRVVEALEESELVVMDDGYQHLAVDRTVDLIVVNADKKIGSRDCLPLGELREPWSSVQTADAICLVSGNPESAPAQAWEAFLTSRFSGTPFFRIERTFDGFGGSAENLEDHNLDGAFAFCGIGEPESFKNLLQRFPKMTLGKVFRDHHVYSEEDIGSIVSLAESHQSSVFVTTEKDWIKVKDLFNARNLPLAWVRMKYDIPANFWYFLEGRLQH